MRAAAPEWARRQPPPENRRLPERRPPEQGLLEQGLLERRLEFRARVRRRYRPTRYVHK